MTKRRRNVVVLERQKDWKDRLTQYVLIIGTCVSTVVGLLAWNSFQGYQRKIDSLENKLRTSHITNLAWESATQNKVSRVDGKFEAAGAKEASDALKTCVADIRKIKMADVQQKIDQGEL